MQAMMAALYLFALPTDVAMYLYFKVGVSMVKL